MSDPLKKINLLESLLPETLCVDRPAIARDIHRLRRARAASIPGKEMTVRIAHLNKRINTSIRKIKHRSEALPEISYSRHLPITEYKNKIIHLIKKHQVLIISGETGSGKTTQIPKFCLEAGRGVFGKIGCTQPRRIAAITVSKRIAEEMGEEANQSVGYKIRFKDRDNENTYIKIMTDGILLAETQSDRFLNEYDTLIVDEAHERSLNIDFILGILKTLLRKRKDLKLIITSATIDTEKFSKAFDDAPVVEVSGRMFPIEVRYFPQEKIQNQKEETTHVDMAVSVVDRLCQESPYGGDILIFMPTERDIRDTCELIQARQYQRTLILPLFARLSGTEQSKIFKQVSARKIIVATNIAETSLTIPGIKYVIDTGLARISRYSPRSRTTALPVVPISKSSADQRKGRCGRVENGICIRLFPEEDYDTRPLFTLPEIHRANLAEVLLRMLALKLGDISRFPFIDRPADKSIKDGVDLLWELGATGNTPGKKNLTHKKISTQKKIPNGPTGFSLTRKGRIMAKIPLDPRLSAMLIEAQNRGCIEDMTVITSVLSIQDPRERPTEKAGEADQAHARFKDPLSDFITFLNIWKAYQHVITRKKTISQRKKFCRDSFLSFRRMREWRDIHGQISQILKETGLSRATRTKEKIEVKKQASFDPLYTAIHKSILGGYLCNIAEKKEKNIYKAAKGKEVMVFPGSTLFNHPKPWIVAAEMVETSRLFARTTAAIDSAWLESLGKSLCRSTYLDPHWEKNRGEVVALEQVSLFGLIIIPQRKISYGCINPEEASEIFLKSALVDGDVKNPLPFMDHNKKEIDAVQNMEARVRRRDILISDLDLFLFYQQRLEGVYDMKTLKNHIKKQKGDRFLRMTREAIIKRRPEEMELAGFPEHLTLGDHQYACEYNFNPGKKEDGITIKIPSSHSHSVQKGSLEWLVPGRLRDKIIALVKGLPKEFRKQLVPVADAVDKIIEEMPKQEGALRTHLSRFIYQRFGVRIPASAWPEKGLPDHLKMRIAVIGPRGEEILCSRDSAVLNRDITAGYKPDGLETAKKRWEKTGLTSWRFPDLPESIRIKDKDSVKWTVYPGLEKAEDLINLRLFLNREKAVASHQKGIEALFVLHLSKDLKFLKKNLALPGHKKRMMAHFGGAASISRMLQDRVIHDLFHQNIRTEKAFLALADTKAPVILQHGQALLSNIMPVLEAYHETWSEIHDLESRIRSGKLISFFQELKNDINNLVPENFIPLYEADRLPHLVRYLKAIRIRVQRGVNHFEKDQEKAKEIIKFNDSLNELLKGLSSKDSGARKKEIEAYFWLIQEYKVSVFAQELKTPFPVSSKRLEKKLQTILLMT